MIKGILRSFALVITSLSAIVFVFGVVPSYADLYKWEDSRGVLHITDDMGKVPESKRHGVKVFSIKPHEKKHIGEGPVYIPATKPTPKKPPVLYGGQPLEWWKETFTRLGEDMDTLTDEISKKRQFITVFEGGRRFGQTFGDLEVSVYKRYKKEIVKDEESMVDLQDKLAELRRKATNNAVPREIRGE